MYIYTINSSDYHTGLLDEENDFIIWRAKGFMNANRFCLS